MEEADRARVKGKPLELSIVIPAYNDWTALDGCLGSIATHAGGPEFEVVVIDDGSDEAAPEEIRRWERCFPLTIVRQEHAGISAARNLGIRISSGAVVLFVDADCRLQENCMAALRSAVAISPRHDYFQLRLIGGGADVVNRAEQLRLATFQHYALQADGCIRYLNTAGFAIRRKRREAETGLFDPRALRGEDTLLLASLMERGELPLFVPDAVVQHALELSLVECFRKDIRSAWLEAPTYRMIASRAINVRVTHGQRLRLLSSMWKAAGQGSIGRTAWLVLVSRQALQRMISYLYRLVPAASGRHK